MHKRRTVSMLSALLLSTCFLISIRYSFAILRQLPFFIIGLLQSSQNKVIFPISKHDIDLRFLLMYKEDCRGCPASLVILEDCISHPFIQIVFILHCIHASQNFAVRLKTFFYILSRIKAINI